MGDAYRMAVEVPWDLDEPPDWGRKFDEPEDVMKEWRERAKKHMGAGFRAKMRGAKTYGPTRTLGEMYDRGVSRLERAEFGDVLFIVALETKVKWLFRKVRVRDASPTVDTEGDGHIDWMFTEIMKDNDFPTAECWGIRNDRFIAGTRIPSLHWARTSPDGCTARAVDFHDSTIDKMWKIAHHLTRNADHTSKGLFAGHEWLPEWGEWRFVGTYIGHYDHGHFESRNRDGSLC